MAPEIALERIFDLTRPGQVVLDPMCGSGTVVELAAREGRTAIGTDVDPLAVMMTRTSCNPGWSVGLEGRATELVRDAQLLSDALPDWILADPESIKFVEYWFAPEQRAALAQLAKALADRPRRDDPLRMALSRIVVTKDAGASLARDTSHSRPHKVRDTNTFDVFDGFIKAARRLERLLEASRRGAKLASIRQADARRLQFLKRDQIDLIVTSPPYLNAIDYLRGHRMSLVWLGHTATELKAVRGTAIGSERGLRDAPGPVRSVAMRSVPELTALPSREQGIVLRFVGDMLALCDSFGRVLKPDGQIVFVVADSLVRGVPVSNSAICEEAAVACGFKLMQREVRPLPEQHRYLPPPRVSSSALGSRMREEVIMTLASA